MQKSRFFYKVLSNIFVFAIVVTAGRLSAQMPTCLPDNTGGFIYFVNGTEIYNWNPALPFSATNPSLNTIVMLPGTYNLAVSANLNNPAGPSPTFYAASTAGGVSGVSNATYRYYNGTAWINTGHLSGSVNIGGGAGAIYGYANDSVATILKYTGAGNATALTTIPDLVFGGPADVQGEAGTDNFYMLRVNAPGWLRKYDGNGNLIYQWDVTYGGANGGGSGFAILNGTLYAKTNDGLYSGVINATTVNLTPVAGAPFSLTTSNDMAACFPGIPTPPMTSNDTIYLCAPVATTISASGTGTYSYTVLNGAPVITGSGPDYAVTTPTLATIVLYSNNPASGASSADTFTIVPAPVADAGMDDTLAGCGNPSGMLNAGVTNTQPWVTYTYSWTPAVTSGGGTLTPAINPSANTTYTFSVATGNAHGNCVISDSVRITVKNDAVMPDFSFELKRNCVADSVLFTNLSQNATQYTWDFGDGNISTAVHPAHVYGNQGSYNVKLKADNGICRDSVIKIIDNTRALAAGFTTNLDTICQGGTVNFTDTSTLQLVPGQYNWNFGDGSTSTLMSPAHTYSDSGVYQVRLVVSDAVPCYDTMIRTIVVDAVSNAMLEKSTGHTCIGIPVHFNASGTGAGLNHLIWDIDNRSIYAHEQSLTHAFDKAGTYYARLKVIFRSCPEQNYLDSVIVHPLPVVNIGPDTTICLDGNPVRLNNSGPAGPDYRYQWNTGDTTPAYTVVHPGTYTLTVSTAYGCTAADEADITKDCYIDIPNAFTPNNDGVDDYFFPRQFLSKGAVSFKMQVFNRWGQIVFETNTANGRGWDGKFNSKDQPQGVYIYRIGVAFKNAKTENYTGNVTLLR